MWHSWLTNFGVLCLNQLVQQAERELTQTANRLTPIEGACLSCGLPGPIQAPSLTFQKAFSPYAAKKMSFGRFRTSLVDLNFTTRNIRPTPTEPTDDRGSCRAGCTLRWSTVIVFRSFSVELRRTSKYAPRTHPLRLPSSSHPLERKRRSIRQAWGAVL